MKEFLGNTMTNENKLHMVLVAVFNRNVTKTILIRKNRGFESLIGKWNFLGGKVEKQETIYQCAVREVMEECGVLIDEKMIFSIGETLDFPSATVHLLYTFVDDSEIMKAETKETEFVDIVMVDSLLNAIEEAPMMICGGVETLMNYVKRNHISLL